MRRYLFLCIAVHVLFAGCGGEPLSNGAAGSEAVSPVEIRLSPESVRVGTPVQLSVDIVVGSGEEISGLTTSYDDPDSNEPIPIEWSISSERLAEIDGGARLIPAAPGYVSVSVNLMGAALSRTIRIFDAYMPYVASPDENAVEEGPVTEEGSDGFCRGHAASVASFLPGSGSGFGAGSLPGIVLGPPQGLGSARGSAHVLSLGRYGEVVLDLGDCALTDGEGADLIVFENPFHIGGDEENPYAELGIVGVSQNGIDYYEFLCEEGGYPYTGCAGWNPVYSSPSNGISPFDVENAGGDHFDLADIGVVSANYVRIRDAGTEGFGTSVGFDLDAISVVNGIRRAP